MTIRKAPTFCSALTIPSVSNPGGRTLKESDPEARALCDRQIRIVGHTIPYGHLAPFSTIMGTPGSGKTLAIKLFLASLLPSVLSSGDVRLTYRIAMFDPKGELRNFLIGLGIDERSIIVTNPYDDRCVAWHLPDDFVDSDDAQSMASAFFPLRPKARNSEHPDFWSNAANDILHKLILALMVVFPKTWALRDLTEVCGYEETITAMLKKTRLGRRAYSAYLDRSKHKDLPGSVLATIRSKMSLFEEVGSLLHNRKTSFSVRRWREGSGIVLLGYDTKHAEQLNVLNNLLMKQFSDTVCSPEWPGHAVDHSWFLLDELVEAGELDGLKTLLNFGRERGARAVLGFCDKSGPDETFQLPKTLLALCDNKILFHLGSSETAEWASKESGIIEQPEISTNTDSEGRVSRHRRISPHERVKPCEFQDLPLANGGTLNGFVIVPGAPVFPTHLPGHLVDSHLPPKLRASEEDESRNFVRRSVEDRMEMPWTLDEFKAAGISPPPDYEQDADSSQDAVQPLAIFQL